MENEKLDLQVGDLVTFKNKEDGASFVDIMTRETIGNYYKQYFQNELEILKIERPKYEVVEEKKELLTEKEKEFLKNICKYYNIRTIYFNKFDIGFYNEHNYLVNALDYPKNMEFNKVKKEKYCTLEELGLEEQ